MEIGFKEGVDYKDSNGLLSINDNILFTQYPEYVQKICENRVIYMVAQIDSLITRGRFVQTLHLIQPYFAGSTAAPATDPSTADPAKSSNTQTISNDNKGTVTANDDALQEVQDTARKPVNQSGEGRQSDNLANKTDAELFRLGYLPDEFDKVRNGGG